MLWCLIRDRRREGKRRNAPIIPLLFSASLLFPVALYFQPITLCHFSLWSAGPSVCLLLPSNFPPNVFVRLYLPSSLFSEVFETHWIEPAYLVFQHVWGFYCQSAALWCITHSHISGLSERWFLSLFRFLDKYSNYFTFSTYLHINHLKLKIYFTTRNHSEKKSFVPFIYLCLMFIRETFVMDKPNQCAIYQSSTTQTVQIWFNICLWLSVCSTDKKIHPVFLLLCFYQV